MPDVAVGGVDVIAGDRFATAQMRVVVAVARPFVPQVGLHLAFALGAACGALGFRYVGFLALLAPVCALAVLALCASQAAGAVKQEHA